MGEVFLRGETRFTRRAEKDLKYAEKQDIRHNGTCANLTNERDHVQNYFGNLYATAETPTIQRNVEGLNSVEITVQTTTETAKKIKNRKSSGPDNIPHELINYIPEELKKSITIPIFKMDDKISPENCRRITLLNSHMKLMTKIVGLTVSEHVGISREQGLLQIISTLDAIVVIRQVR